MSKCIPAFKTTQRPHDGFTLLELLISSVILAVILIILVGMADGVSRIWRDGERRREASREARAGLELMIKDLHSAVITANPGSFQITQDPKQTNSFRLFFLVSHPGEKRSHGNEGDLCATGYFLSEDPEEHGMHNLYRFHASGNSVTAAIQNNSLPQLYTTAFSENAERTELIGRHIVQLEVRPLQHPLLSNTLLLSVSAVGGETVRMIGSHNKDSDKERNERLLEAHRQRYVTIVRLPPQRSSPSEP